MIRAERGRKVGEKNNSKEKKKKDVELWEKIFPFKERKHPLYTLTIYKSLIFNLQLQNRVT